MKIEKTSAKKEKLSGRWCRLALSVAALYVFGVLSKRLVSVTNVACTAPSCRHRSGTERRFSIRTPPRVRGQCWRKQMGSGGTGIGRRALHITLENEGKRGAKAATNGHGCMGCMATLPPRCRAYTRMARQAAKQSSSRRTKSQQTGSDALRRWLAAAKDA